MGADGSAGTLARWIERAIARVGLAAAARLREGAVIHLPVQSGVLSVPSCGALLGGLVFAISLAALPGAAGVFFLLGGVLLLAISLHAVWPNRHGGLVLEGSGVRARLTHKLIPWCQVVACRRDGHWLRVIGQDGTRLEIAWDGDNACLLPIVTRAMRA